MNDERNTASGSRVRMSSIIATNFSPLPHRFMPRSSAGSACWSERSKYGTTVGSSSIVAISGSRTSLG